MKDLSEETLGIGRTEEVTKNNLLEFIENQKGKSPVSTLLWIMQILKGDKKLVRVWNEGVDEITCKMYSKDCSYRGGVKDHSLIVLLWKLREEPHFDTAFLNLVKMYLQGKASIVINVDSGMTLEN